MVSTLPILFTDDPNEARLMLLLARCNLEIAFGMNSVGQTQSSALRFS